MPSAMKRQESMDAPALRPASPVVAAGVEEAGGRMASTTRS
jgi:hypothetical protein